MKIFNVFLITIVIVLVTSLLAAWFIPSVQDFMAGNTMWNGVRDFMKESDVQTIDSVNQPSASPEESATIIIPYIDYSDEELSQLKDYTEQGGTLLLMDDYGFGNKILEYFGVEARFSGKPLLDPLFCYKNQWLPKITDFAPDYEKGDVKEVVLNHATVLENIAEADVIAWSSPTSFLDVNESTSWDTGEPKGHLPVAAKLLFGKGVIVLAADPSLIIDSMINRDDNANFVASLLNIGGEKKETSLDVSHLTKTPLDVSKSALSGVRSFLATPYPLLTILIVMFVTVSRFMLRIGG
ncbi:MAG: DUF4350 domain-containing protein [Chloroflexi bacterium]|nr:DUF4350 domain-containing protein [Chloroflexota bacterium]